MVSAIFHNLFTYLFVLFQFSQQMVPRLPRFPSYFYRLVMLLWLQESTNFMSGGKFIASHKFVYKFVIWSFYLPSYRVITKWIPNCNSCPRTLLLLSFPAYLAIAAKKETYFTFDKRFEMKYIKKGKPLFCININYLTISYKSTRALS